MMDSVPTLFETRGRRLTLASFRTLRVVTYTFTWKRLHAMYCASVRFRRANGQVADGKNGMDEKDRNDVRWLNSCSCLNTFTAPIFGHLHFCCPVCLFDDRDLKTNCSLLYVWYEHVYTNRPEHCHECHHRPDVQIIRLNDNNNNNYTRSAL